MNDECWLSCVYSILKTRHLFPGKEDLLPSYYNNSNNHVSKINEMLPLTIVVDTITQLSIVDINLAWFKITEHFP